MTLPALGRALYFIDVLACLLFCLTLALVGARFAREHAVPLELPQLDPAAGAGLELEATTLTLRGADPVELFYGDATEPISLDELEQRLRTAAPATLRLRSEASPLTDVIALAHEAGVTDIQLAYQTERVGHAP